MRNPFLLAPLACLILSVSATDSRAADIRISITVGPPPLPLYDQPECPSDGYLWNPGYWAWGGDGYYWVPGTWVQPPVIGLLWTPGYWGWNGGTFEFHRGYWSRHVGFYGGINYGYGYGGRGFDGGYWQGRHYSYNRAITNVNPTRVRNVYTRSVMVQNDRHTAYNGGRGGVIAAPAPPEQTARRDQRVSPTRTQTLHEQSASRNQDLRASVNRGKPPVAATGRAADFSPRHSVPARAPGGHVDEDALRARPNMPPPSPQDPGRKVDRTPERVAPRPGPEPRADPRERPVRERSERDPRSQPAPHPADRPRPEPAPSPRHVEPRPNHPELPRLKPQSHPIPQPRPRPGAPGKEDKHR